jgi:hypothetical protein
MNGPSAIVDLEYRVARVDGAWFETSVVLELELRRLWPASATMVGTWTPQLFHRHWLLWSEFWYRQFFIGVWIVRIMPWIPMIIDLYWHSNVCNEYRCYIHLSKWIEHITYKMSFTCLLPNLSYLLCNVNDPTITLNMVVVVSKIVIIQGHSP